MENKIMNEIFFILFLISGAIKPFLEYYHIPTGIDFTLFTAVIITILMLKDLIRHKFVIRIDKLTRYAGLLLITLFILILFSLFYTSSQQYVYTKILQFFTILLGFFFPLLVQNFSIQKFLRWFIISIFGLAIIFLPLFISGYGSFSTDYVDFQDSPLKSIYESYLTMGYLMAIALIINIYSPIFTGARKSFITLFLFGALLTTGARGPLFGFIIVLLLFLLFRGYTIKKPKVSTIIGSIIVIGVLSAYTVTKLDISGLLERTYDRITTIKKDSSANDRLVRANYVLNQIDVEHLAFGYGFGSFGYEYTKQDTRNYPHNMALEILFELGAVGVLIYASLLILIVRQLVKTQLFLPWALFIFLFFNSLKSLSLTDSRVLFGFFAILLLYKIYQKSLDQEKIQ